MDVGTKRATTGSRIECLSENVAAYLAGAQIPQGPGGDEDDSMDDE
jgi:hypothetical protein